MEFTVYSYKEAKVSGLEQELRVLFKGQYSHWQSSLWADVQSVHQDAQWPSLYVYKRGGNIVIAGMGYKRVLRGELHWLYFSRGPLLSAEATTEDLRIFMSEVVDHQGGTCVWVRIDPLLQTWPKGLDHKEVLRVAHKEFHPVSTQVVNISLTKEEILAQMKPKGRYNIRLAEKKGVRTCIVYWDRQGSQWIEVGESGLTVPEHPLDIYDHINMQTTARDGFAGHDKAYYEHMLHSLGEQGYLVLAQYEGRWLAGAVCVLGETTGYYYYGASTDTDRKVMAPYAVQWASMMYAKQKSMTVYDFLGIAEESKGDKDPLWGVTSFKKKFGGEVYSTVGTWEYVAHPLWYKAIKVRKWLQRITSH